MATLTCTIASETFLEGVKSPHKEALTKYLEGWRLVRTYVDKKDKVILLVSAVSSLSVSDSASLPVSQLEAKSPQSLFTLKIVLRFEISSNEIELLSDLGDMSKHIVSLENVKTFGNVDVLVLPYVGVPLSSVKLSLQDSITCFRHSLQAVSRLHQNGVIHRDLSPSNILWRKDSQAATLIDLEYAADTIQKSHWLTVETGTVGYLAPELKKAGKQTFESDLWALGTVMLETFLQRNSVLIDGNMSRSRLTELRNELFELHGKVKVTIAVWSLLIKLLRIDARKRMKASDVLERINCTFPVPEQRSREVSLSSEFTKKCTFNEQKLDEQ